MTSVIKTTSRLRPDLPDHTELPDSDDNFVKNFQEHPQSILLTDSIQPVLDRLHPDGQYCIGQDSGIYWRLTEPPLDGAEAPDWFYVPDVPRTLNGQLRRSYVIWQELTPPAIAIEFVSGNGKEERDPTPLKGKFWVYEQGIKIPYYAIYEVQKARVEVYQLQDDRYVKLSPNFQGRYPIHLMGVELGIWSGRYQTMQLPWLRWWDEQGNLLLTGSERAEIEQREKQLAQQQLEQERQRVERLAAQLRSLGIEPEL